MMEKEKLLELALKLGIKKENFELGFEKNPDKLETQIVAGAKHMGFLKEGEGLAVEERKQ